MVAGDISAMLWKGVISTPRFSAWRCRYRSSSGSEASWAWVPFRAASLTDAGQFALGLVRAPWTGPVPVAALGVAAVAVAAQLVPPAGSRRLFDSVAGLHPVAQSGLAGAFLFLVVALGPTGVAPFIYFRF